MSIANDFIKHHIFLDRLARGLAKDYETAFKAIAAYIEREVRRNTDFVELAMLRNEIQKRMDTITEHTIKRLEEFAVYEAKFSKKTLKKHTKKDITIPTDSTIKDIERIQIATSPGQRALTLRTTFDAFAQSKTNEYMRAMSDAAIQESSKLERNNKISDLSEGMFSTQANALLGLGVLAVSSDSLKKVMFENDLPRLQWLAVLDSHVCPYCQGLHGRVFEIDDTPAHPAHGNCRCSLVPHE